jgi:hypothetical protein
MLNSAPGALVKHIDKEILSWNSRIQCIESVKSCIYHINFMFYFYF